MVKVSVLMNGYNSEKYLEEAIDSVYSQTYTDWEIIFIDNCSTDNTKKIVDSYGEKLKYYKTDKNVPLGAARNFGLKYCKGEYLAFLDTDDIWLSNKLEMQVNLMKKNKNLQMSYTGAIYIDGNSKETGKLIPIGDSGDVFAQQLKKYEINMQSVLIRNDIPIRFNEDMRFSPDFDLFMKISVNHKVGVIKSCLVKYRKLDNSLTSKTIDRWWIEVKQTLDEIAQENPNIIEKHSIEYRLAYAKVAYYKARYLISINKKKQAVSELDKYKFLNLTYFLLFTISLFPRGVWDFIHKHK